jgi:hypothetical protein
VRSRFLLKEMSRMREVGSIHNFFEGAQILNGSRSLSGGRFCVSVKEGNIMTECLCQVFHK